MSTTFVGPVVYDELPAGGIVFGGSALVEYLPPAPPPEPFLESLWPGGGGSVDSGELIGLPKPRRRRLPKFDPPPPFRPASWPEPVAIHDPRSMNHGSWIVAEPDTLLEETVELLVLGLI